MKIYSTSPIVNGRNIEIKAHARDWHKLYEIVRSESDTPGTIIRQIDTFFNVMRGRLKLRQIGDHHGELIFYKREDCDGPRVSNYQIFPTEHPNTLRDLMTAALGIRGVVAKTRNLFWIGQTRIHLDEVDGLGRFIELEVVLRSDQVESNGSKVACEIMNLLSICENDIIQCSYMDLLESAGSAADVL